MEKLTGLCVLLAALSLAVTEDKLFTEGGSLTLDVSPPYPDPIKNIVWKFRGDLLAEWIKDKVPVEFYRSFNGRSTLDTENGRLVVNSMSQADTGEYSVEINNNVQSVSYTAKWIKTAIKSVPQPVVVITCAASSECTVSCDGDTTGAEPVTYKWNIGDRELLGKDRKLTDTKNGHDKLITCRMTNPLSEKVSETFNNPFYKEELEPSDVLMIVMIVMIVFLLIVVVVLCILAKKQKDELTFRRRRQLIVDGLIWLQTQDDSRHWTDYWTMKCYSAGYWLSYWLHERPGHERPGHERPDGLLACRLWLQSNSWPAAPACLQDCRLWLQGQLETVHYSWSHCRSRRWRIAGGPPSSSVLLNWLQRQLEPGVVVGGQETDGLTDGLGFEPSTL